MRSGLRRVPAVALVVGLIAIAVGFGPAAARADDPTWAQVQAAKNDVKKKAAVVAAIETTLGGLEAQAARLGTVALQKAAVASAAASRLQAAQHVYDLLEQQTTAASGKALTARRTAASVATQLYRGGDPDLQVWLSGRSSGSLLYRLGALSQIGDTSSALLSQAEVDEQQAKSLGDQAKAQAAVRNALADQARAAANVAQAAQQAADRQVAQTKAQRAQLQAQLATLQARSSALQDSYAAAQRARAAAAARGATAGGTGLGGITGGPDSLSPAGAQAYAASRLGAYGWGGDQMSCLISLWNIESGWRWNAYNASSGAYGIPQSLPGSKMATEGGDWTTSSKTQIEWGLGYIQARYSTPCAAYAFETSHVPYWY
ncbi:aggregation-promoting factor C-terminal-like domain-containing protein [Amnibacterium kyonggiense]